MPLHRPCTHLGPQGPCPEYATQGGRCDTHQRAAWETTTTSRHERGYDARWVKVRNAYVKAHPTCEALGCDQPTTEVDHIVPLAQGGAKLDKNNLQALCGPHHAEKTTKDRTRPTR